VGPREIHLVHLSPGGKDREMEVTSGWSIFNFDPHFPSRQEVPLTVHALSNAVFSIQPARRLTDGEYMIVIGPVAASGFEFRIACIGGNDLTMPKIDAKEPGK
jgi:hypothetical protein